MSSLWILAGALLSLGWNIYLRGWDGLFYREDDSSLATGALLKALLRNIAVYVTVAVFDAWSVHWADWIVWLLAGFMIIEETAKQYCPTLRQQRLADTNNRRRASFRILAGLMDILLAITLIATCIYFRMNATIEMRTALDDANSVQICTNVGWRYCSYLEYYLNNVLLWLGLASFFPVLGMYNLVCFLQATRLRSRRRSN